MLGLIMRFVLIFQSVVTIAGSAALHSFVAGAFSNPTSKAAESSICLW